MTIHESLALHIDEMESLLNRQRFVIAQLGQIGESQLALPLSAFEGTRQPLKEVVLEAIEELEISRKAFKSRQLEALRKKLIRALAESG